MTSVVSCVYIVVFIYTYIYIYIQKLTHHTHARTHVRTHTHTRTHAHTHTPHARTQRHTRAHTHTHTHTHIHIHTHTYTHTHKHTHTPRTRTSTHKVRRTSDWVFHWSLHERNSHSRHNFLCQHKERLKQQQSVTRSLGFLCQSTVWIISGRYTIHSSNQQVKVFFHNFRHYSLSLERPWRKWSRMNREDRNDDPLWPKDDKVAGKITRSLDKTSPRGHFIHWLFLKFSHCMASVPSYSYCSQPSLTYQCRKVSHCFV